MKKDVIYIDIEDDITAVIERVKTSTENIIALVPPKGSAVLQSAVNLKLLKRAAASVGKKPVIVTSNHALITLAGGLDFYIAKNLQSKPMLMNQASEIIDKSEVEISDNVGDLDESSTKVSLADINDSDEVELSEDELTALASENAEEEPVGPIEKTKKPKNKAIPNFDSFRKKLFIGGGVFILLMIVALAVFGRAKASVVIRAETTPVDVAFEANINANATQSDPANFALKALYQETKKSVSLSFTPTGQKDLGNKASGTMKLTRTSISSTPISVPAGTQFTSGDFIFISTEAAQIAGTSIGPGGLVQDSKTVNVEAAEPGDRNNISARSFNSSISGISAQGSNMTGGTSRVVKVVTQEDVNKAKEQANQQDTSQVKEELRNALGEAVVLEESFTVAIGEGTSEPAVDQEANEGKLVVPITYSMLGLDRKDLGAALDAFVVTKMTNSQQQRVYSNGLDGVSFEKVSGNDRTGVYKITTLAQYGPQFDVEDLKSNLAGKKFGEMRSYLQDLPGVKSVDINLSPFWARKAPNTQRIDIKLDVDSNNSGR